MAAIARWNPFLPSTYRELFPSEWLPRGLTLRNLFEFPTLDIFETRDVPEMDVYAEDKDMVIKIELPEYTTEDVDISVDGAHLSISGKHEHEEKIEERDYILRERRAGSFTRVVPLAREVKEEDITASLKEGVLEVRVKGGAEERAVEGKKKIPIAAS